MRPVSVRAIIRSPQNFTHRRAKCTSVFEMGTLAVECRNAHHVHSQQQSALYVIHNSADCPALTPIFPPRHHPSCRSPYWCCQGVPVCPAATWSHLSSWQVWGGRSSSTTRYDRSVTPGTTACRLWDELLLQLVVPCFL